MVAPYPDLFEVAEDVVEHNALDVIVELGDLEKGIDCARERITSDDIDIVISRGGTASLLRQHLDRIVLEIAVTGYDLLRAIYPHIIANEKTAIVGYDNIIHGARSINTIIGSQIGIFTVSEALTPEDAVNTAIRWGAEIIIGDAVSIAIGKQKGLKVELIRSGKEAVLTAIDHASQLRQQISERTATLKRMNAIIDHANIGILYVDGSKTIKQINNLALEYLQRTPSQLLNHRIQQTCLSDAVKEALETESEDMAGIVVRLGSKSLYLEKVTLSISGRSDGVIWFLQDVSRIQKLETQIRKTLSEKGLQAHYTFDKMITSDQLNRDVIEKSKQYSLTDSTILLVGETGSGKEVFAQSIHNSSPRRNGPFVAVNCAVLPETLLESELFGYVDGAFTGAKKGGRRGLFEMAHQGTIFLDEINEMSMKLQARFLRVLQEKEIMRLGGERVISVDVRVIAACNKNLYEEVLGGRFRRDLFYRISVLDISIPPLRERSGDVQLLFRHFVTRFSEKYDYPTPRYSATFADKLRNYSWPGNIRELENFAEKFVLLSSIGEARESLLDDKIHEANKYRSDSTNATRSLREIEVQHIEAVLSKTGHNVSRAARILGITRSTLRRKLNSDETEKSQEQ